MPFSRPTSAHAPARLPSPGRRRLDVSVRALLPGHVPARPRLGRAGGGVRRRPTGTRGSAMTARTRRLGDRAFGSPSCFRNARCFCFGVPCAPLWFLTILLSHGTGLGLVDAACVTNARHARRRGSLLPRAPRMGRSAGTAPRPASAHEVGAAVYGASVASAPDGRPSRAVPCRPSSRGVRLAGGPATGPAIHAPQRSLGDGRSPRRVQRVPQAERLRALDAVRSGANDGRPYVGLRRASRPSVRSAFPTRARVDTLCVFLNAQRFKARTCCSRCSARWCRWRQRATMTYAWGGEEHMLAPAAHRSTWISPT